jgi:hypothetical protein
LVCIRHSPLDAEEREQVCPTPLDVLRDVHYFGEVRIPWLVLQLAQPTVTPEHGVAPLTIELQELSSKPPFWPFLLVGVDRSALVAHYRHTVSLLASALGLSAADIAALEAAGPRGRIPAAGVPLAPAAAP